jgi:hypothetical protein
LYAFLISCATGPAHLLLDLVTLIIFGKIYKLCSSSLCSLHQPPATSSLVQIFSSASCYQTPLGVRELKYIYKINSYISE